MGPCRRRDDVKHRASRALLADDQGEQNEVQGPGGEPEESGGPAGDCRQRQEEEPHVLADPGAADDVPSGPTAIVVPERLSDVVSGGSHQLGGTRKEPGLSPHVIPIEHGANPLRDPNNILSKRSVYFDYDSFVVKDEYRPLVEAHARYLQQNRSARATVQGNTDERGSREYNIALGQKRADSVKRMMTLLGATESQIETVSFGKEKPKNPGHDESAYAENRRDDILYAGE